MLDLPRHLRRRQPREERRTKALADALPALRSRVTHPGLRRHLLQQARDNQLAELADQGVVLAAAGEQATRRRRRDLVTAGAASCGLASCPRTAGDRS
ncbi:hypothetical protein ABTY96_36580 [Streptomyces sp. NPDC096057]|uniref:hypothetical protein n=1 Tax=Streptomyces sp. NPDC096057 TaxID=3155543 RepID=UPI00332D1A0D